MILEPDQQGTAPFRGGATWYRITGDLESPLAPLVVLHGGPGVPHDYVLSLTALALRGRAVIHYDQFGCGSSTHRPDEGEDFWTVDLFLDELDNLLDHLGIADSYHLLGQSWGGMLGAEHAIRQPKGLRSLVLSNSPASMELWVSEAMKQRAALPESVRDALDTHEANGTTDDPQYLEATQFVYDLHVCRVVPSPPEEVHSMVAPTLLASGRFDEATPATIQPFFDAINDVRWEIFENSSHMPFVEEPDLYMEQVGDFLAEH